LSYQSLDGGSDRCRDQALEHIGRRA
jgi:hypothetical protein